MRPDRGGFINACRVLLDSRAVRHGSQAGGERTTSVRLSFLYKTVENSDAYVNPKTFGLSLLVRSAENLCQSIQIEIDLIPLW